jgi:RecA-family ATPase
MKDKHKTKVIFLINETNGELFAFFPEENYNTYPSDLRTSYAHIGQHSPCSIEYANESRKATEEEYKELKEELDGIGYNLDLIKNLWD